MSDFLNLKEEVQRGLLGRNSGVPMGFRRLNHYLSIRRKIYTTIIAGTGMGKSSFLQNAFILNPYDYSISKYNTGNIKFKVILFSMERSKLYTLARWISRRIFLDHGILVPVGKLLGWWDEKLTHEEHDLFLLYEDYLQEMLETKVVDIIEGVQNPTGVYKYVKDYALTVGRLEKTDEFHEVYIPNDPSQVTIIAVDHISLTKKEKGLLTKKDAIDKLSGYLQYFRDRFSFSPVVVCQMNRDISNPLILKTGEAEPTIESAKDSGSPIDDCDSCISLFNALRYKQNDPSGYDLEKFVDPSTGGNFFRSLKILKSTYSESEVRIGLAFHGATGSYKELPKVRDMDSFDYQSLFTGEYFLNNKNI